MIIETRIGREQRRMLVEIRFDKIKSGIKSGHWAVVGHLNFQQNVPGLKCSAGVAVGEAPMQRCLLRHLHRATTGLASCSDFFGYGFSYLTTNSTDFSFSF